MTLLDNITTLLFDFDNTLLLMNENKFVMKYASKLAKRFEDIFPSTEVFIHHLLEGTKCMITKKGDENNVTKFFEYFSNYCGDLSYDEVYNRFYDFYDVEFNEVKEITSAHPIAKKLIQIASKNYEIVIATNPLFPEVAMRNRLDWVEILEYWENGSISLVTHAELFSKSKPQLEYYQEILKIINKTAEECLMIGNDYYNDGASSLVGIKFYHVLNDGKYNETDLLSMQTKDSINHEKIIISGSGSLNNLYELFTKI